MSKKEIKVPDIGGAKNVDVIEVLVSPGDHVAVEDSLITLEGDKATMEVPASEAGVVESIAVKVGDKVSEGSLILTLNTESAQSSEVEKKAPTEPQATTTLSSKNEPLRKEEASQKEIQPSSETRQASETVYASPGVRRTAREMGVDLSKVSGSGPKGRILKQDLHSYVKEQLQSGSGFGLPQMPVVDFSKFGDIEIKPLNKIKKLTGQFLHRSWMTVPHVTQFGEADITELEAFRQKEKEFAQKQGIKLTPLVFVMKAVVKSLKAFPHFNASLDPGGEKLILKNYYHIGVAVDTPSGLVVPVIRDVDKKGLLELAKELGEISQKARETGLTPKEMSGGCFTISSLGGIGGTAFTPIVNAPEVAILGLSRSSMKPVFQKEGFVPRLTLPLSLSYDHRVIDGAEGARFMVNLIKHLTDIRTCLL